MSTASPLAGRRPQTVISIRMIRQSSTACGEENLQRRTSSPLWRLVKSEQKVRHLIAITIEVRDRDFQDSRQPHGHLKIRLMDANLVAIDSRRGDKLVESGSDPNVLLAQAASKPRLLESLAPHLVGIFSVSRLLHLATRFVAFVQSDYYDIRSLSFEPMRTEREAPGQRRATSMRERKVTERNPTVQPSDWQSRPLCESYLLVIHESIPIQLLERRLVRDQIVFWALGVLADGAYEVLGVWPALTPDGWCAQEVADDLKARGVERIRFHLCARDRDITGYASDSHPSCERRGRAAPAASCQTSDQPARTIFGCCRCFCIPRECSQPCRAERLRRWCFRPAGSEESCRIWPATQPYQERRRDSGCQLSDSDCEGALQWSQTGKPSSPVFERR